MARFVKWRKKVKEVIVIITIVMLLLSSIVMAETITIDKESTTYNVFGMKEVIVIDGARPEGEEVKPNIFYAEDDASVFYNAYKNSDGKFEFITEE